MDHVIKDCPKNPRIQQVEEEVPEVLFIGNVKGEEWKRVPMKVKLGDFVKAPAVKGKRNNESRFKVLEVDEPDDDEVVQVRAVECEPCGERCVKGNMGVKSGKAGEGSFRGKACAVAVCEVPGSCSCAVAPHTVPGSGTHVKQVPQPGTQGAADNEEYKVEFPDGMEEVKYVMAVETGSGWASLGMGDIVVDSAADESCWPVGQGDAFPTKPSKKNMILKTANGGDMGHYGQKEVIFEHANSKDPIGLTFQVTDVKKPLLAVRRLVEKGNKVVLSGVDGESYIQNEQSKVKVPLKKKGGSFVIEAHFVKEISPGFAWPA